MKHICPTCKGELFPNPMSNYWFCDKDHVYTGEELAEWEAGPQVSEREAIVMDSKSSSHKGKCTCGSASVKGPGHSDWCDINPKDDDDDELTIDDLFDELTLELDLDKLNKKP